MAGEAAGSGGGGSSCALWSLLATVPAKGLGLGAWPAGAHADVADGRRAALGGGVGLGGSVGSAPPRLARASGAMQTGGKDGAAGAGSGAVRGRSPSSRMGGLGRCEVLPVPCAGCAMGLCGTPASRALRLRAQRAAPAGENVRFSSPSHKQPHPPPFTRCSYTPALGRDLRSKTQGVPAVRVSPDQAASHARQPRLLRRPSQGHQAAVPRVRHAETGHKRRDGLPWEGGRKEA
jgi:hypothetical protein